MTDLTLLPNLISIGRIILIIPTCLLYPSREPAAYWAVVVLLFLSYLSDYADGYLARRLHLTSKLGLILDPLADKLWSVTMVVLLVTFRDFPMWIALVIALRDVLIIMINGRMLRRIGKVMPSDDVGRTYMIVLGLMIIGVTMRLPGMVYVGYGLTLFAAITLGRYYIRARSLVLESLKSAKSVTKVTADV